MNIKLLFHKIYLALVKRSKSVGAKKTYATWKAKGYNNTPEVSFIIQSHNKSLEVKHIVSKLRNKSDAEIIVIDDGSSIRHTKELATYLSRANEFLIHANDLYENIMYDKAIRYSNGKYIILLQDDDDFINLEWVDKGLSYLKEHPKMVILGGNGGHDFIIDEVKKQGVGVPYKNINSETNFRFVHHVDRAPMFIVRSLFLDKIFHIDFEFAPFQFDDCEMCLRAWLNDLQVGWFNAGFSSLSAGGMRIWNNSFSAAQCEKNSHLLYKKYAGQDKLIDCLVEKACKEL